MEKWIPTNLNRLCYAIGSISGAMQARGNSYIHKSRWVCGQAGRQAGRQAGIFMHGFMGGWIESVGVDELMHGCLYIYIYIYIYIYVCAYGGQVRTYHTEVRRHACGHVCMYVCMYVCIHLYWLVPEMS